MRRSTVVTIQDVARESGYSTATVSIVLNSAPLSKHITTGTRQLIETAARQLGYRPNPWARLLHGQRSNILGVVVFDITDPCCTPIIYGIENSLYHANYVSLLADAHNERPRFEHYLHTLLDLRVEGLIVINDWRVQEITLPTDLTQKRVPTVMVGGVLNTDGVSTVSADEAAGAWSALHLLHRLGHRHIAFIRGPKNLASTGQRWRGIRSFAREAGIELDQDRIADLPESVDMTSSFEAGAGLTEELLSRGKSFTALMAFDDLTALGALRALKNKGVQVPEECSVVGFGDIPHASLSAPSLSTVRVPLESMGELSTGIVLDGIATANRRRDFAVVRHRVPTTLMVRESTQQLSR